MAGLEKKVLSPLSKKKPLPSGLGVKLLSVAKAAAPAGVVVGAALATAAAISGLKSIAERVTRDSDFKNALAESPAARKNQMRAYKHFMTLRRMNRTLSKDPLVAAGYMNKGMSFEQEGIDPSIALALQGSKKEFEAGYDPMVHAEIHQKMLGRD
jgi:hypothetical protein